jgi:hypothetical protein
MTSSKRIPLNPCDNLYLAHHRALQRSARSGNIALMMIDVEGLPDPDDIQRALAGAMLAHPLTIARLKVSLLKGRPYWEIPRSLPQAAHLAAEQAHTFDDLRTERDWRTKLDKLCLQRYTPDWNLAAGPQVRLEQYALPTDQTRFCICWPHLMMDAEGAQLFLGEIGRQHPGHSGTRPLRDDGLPPEILPDDHAIDVLADHSWTQRLRWFRRGFSVNANHRRLNIQPLIQATKHTPTTFGLVDRNWTPDQFRRIQAHAKRSTPAGPALYARHLAACVIRALHRLHTEVGRHTDAYLITLPLRVTLRDRDGNLRRQRPVPGNYLVSPVLCCRKDLVDDRPALAADILQQLDAYHRAEGDLAQWALISAAAHLRASWYPLLFKLPFGFGSLCSGFSYYGEPAREVRSIGGRTVTNIWGAGPLSTPPGWNPTFSRFRDRLNLTLTWNRDDVPDELARRYTCLIEEEIFNDA